jgi:hypothetical protein
VRQHEIREWQQTDRGGTREEERLSEVSAGPAPHRERESEAPEAGVVADRGVHWREVPSTSAQPTEARHRAERGAPRAVEDIDAERFVLEGMTDGKIGVAR